MPIVRLADLPIYNNNTAGSFVTLIDPSTGNVFRAEKDTLLTGSFDGTASFASVAEYAMTTNPANTVTSFNTRVGSVTLQSTDIAGLGAGILSSSAFSSPSQGTLRATVNGVQTDVDLGLQTGDSVTFLNLTGSNALFTGAITAQTLVVQTVTSSIVYSSGSNTFGNKMTDVQQVTGSLLITGSVVVTGGAITGSLKGNLDGNAATVTNGVYTNGSYADPSWITSLAGSKISGNISGNAANITAYTINQNLSTTSSPTFSTVTAALSGNATTATTWATARTITIGSTGKSVDGSGNVSWTLSEIGAAATNQTMYIGTTAVAINRGSAALSLTGVNIDGNAGTVTNGVYTNGTYADPSWITSLAGSKISGNISGNAANITAYTINQNLSTTSSPTFSTVTATLSGNASTATVVNGTSGQNTTKDDRIIEPNSITSGRMQFGFTSWANNNGSPYADYLHLRSYTDSSGGNDNLLMFRKDALGIRIWQQAWDSATAYSSYKDIAWTDGTNATGTWGIGITGNAGTVTNGVYTTGDQTIGGNKTFSSTITGSISGNANSSTYSIYLGGPADSIDAEDISTRKNSGFYQSNSPGSGWPSGASSWWHMHTTTHSNGANYYAMQLAASFFSQGLWYRSTNGSGTTAWSQVVLNTGTWGISITGNAGTATTWATARTLTIGSTGKSVDGSGNVSWTLGEIGAAATNQTMFIGTTSVAINRASANLALTGITSIDGNAATVTNGVYTTGDQTIGGTKTFSSTITGSITGNAATATSATSANKIVSPYQEWDFSLGSHQTNPMSINLYDNYVQAGAPTSYGTLLDIYGLSGHQEDQLYFAQGQILHRYGWYGNDNWSAWKTIPFSDGTYASGTWGISITGNAATVTNGVYTTGDQTIGGTKTFSSTIAGSINGNAATATAWATARTITIGSTGKSVDGSGNVSWTLGEIGAAATNQTMHIGTTAVAINRASANLALTGITSIDGNAATVTNGMYLSGNQDISGVKTFYTPSGQTFNASSGNIGLSVYNPAAGDAMMTFHVGGDYAGYFGLGGAENDLVWTGWSVGNNRYRILHTGNYNSYAPALNGTGATGTWGISITGNAATVTNGVYTNGSYSDPAWITSLAGSKISGNISGNAANITAYTINQSVGTSNGPTFAGITSTANINLNSNELRIGSTSTYHSIEVGVGRTGNGFAYIDLIGDTTYDDFGLRIMRGDGGSNTYSILEHRGTGDFIIETNDQAALVLTTWGTARAVVQSDGDFRPGADNTYKIGTPSYRWYEVYSAIGTINTSDAREKKDISDSDLGLDFITKLRPVSFKMKRGRNIETKKVTVGDDGKEKVETITTPTEGKMTHYGLIAQEVKAVIGEKNFAGYVEEEGVDTLGLRYTEFIAPMIKAIQEQQAQIETLKAEIAALKNP